MGMRSAFRSLTWLLFLKIFDDREQEYELDGAYQSPIPAKLRWRSWAANEEGITGDDLLQFVDGKLFPALKNQEKMLASDNPRARVVYDVFVDSYNYMKIGDAAAAGDQPHQPDRLYLQPGPAPVQ